MRSHVCDKYAERRKKKKKKKKDHQRNTSDRATRFQNIIYTMCPYKYYIYCINIIQTPARLTTLSVINAQRHVRCAIFDLFRSLNEQ